MTVGGSLRYRLHKRVELWRSDSAVGKDIRHRCNTPQFAKCLEYHNLALLHAVRLYRLADNVLIIAAAFLIKACMGRLHLGI